MSNNRLRWRVMASLALAAMVAGGIGLEGWGAPPKSNAEIEAAIRGVLVQRHPTDTPEWWRGLGPNAPGVILSMSEKESRIYHRVRLVDALAWFPDDARAVEFLKRQAETTDEDAIRQAAVKSVGISQGAAELDFLSKQLAHPDPQTRLAAAQGLQRSEDPRARKALERYLSQEKADWIVRKLRSTQPEIPPGGLARVGSSRDIEDGPKIDPVFAGEWKGFWIAPESAGRGLVAKHATLQLREQGGKRLVGELSVEIQGLHVKGDGKAQKLQKVTLGALEVEQKRFTGTISRKQVEFAGDTAVLPTRAGDLQLEGQLMQIEGARVWTLEVRIPKVGVILILRKSL